MKKIFYIAILLFSTSCDDVLTVKDIQQVHPGMHYNEIEQVLKDKMKFDDIRSETFTMWANFTVEGVSNFQTAHFQFSRKDSILTSMY